MLIRQEQIDAFSEPMMRGFENRMATRLRSRFPEKLAGVSDDDLRQLIRAGIEKAQSYNVELDADVSRYLEYITEYGPDFDARTWALRVLGDAGLNGSRKMDLLDDVKTFELR